MVFAKRPKIAMSPYYTISSNMTCISIQVTYWCQCWCDNFIQGTRVCHNISRHLQFKISLSLLEPRFSILNLALSIVDVPWALVNCRADLPSAEHHSSLGAVCRVWVSFNQATNDLLCSYAGWIFFPQRMAEIVALWQISHMKKHRVILPAGLIELYWKS